MTRYHRNSQSLEVEPCSALVACEHGDINTHHSSDPEGVWGSDMAGSLELFGRVRAMREHVDAAKAADPALEVEAVVHSISRLAYTAGLMSNKTLGPEMVAFRDELKACQTELVAVMARLNERASSTTGALELAQALNLLAELGSSSVMKRVHEA